MKYMNLTMDQQNLVNSIEYTPALYRGPLRLRRRRRGMALATAAVLASASTSSAFPRSSQQPQQRPAHALSMVSFLDTSMTAAVAMPQTKGKRTSPARTKKTKARIRKGPVKKEDRTIEIDLQTGYEFLGLELDDLVAPSLPARGREGASRSVDDDDASASRKNSYESELDIRNSIKRSRAAPPAIDSEILYEGITSAPAKRSTPPKARARASSAATTTTPSRKGARRSESTAATTATASAGTASDRSKPNRPKKAAAAASTRRTKPTTSSASPSRSSTMPGFAKDDELDDHIARLGLSRLPPARNARGRPRARLSARSASAARLKRRAANSESLYRKSAAVPDSFMDYAQEIHGVSRVTPKEEKELGTKTQEAIRLQGLHGELRGKYGRDPTDDEWCAAAGKVNVVAIQEAIEDGMRAKNQLVASNLRMVQRVVNLYIRNGLGSEYNAGDLMQDGTMALIRAAEKYEPDRGFRFSTYAMYWIRSAVKRSQTSQSRIVTVPQRLHETHKRISKHEVSLRKELGRESTKAELAEACDITVLQLDRCRKAMSQVTFSLDAEVQNHHKPNAASSRKDTMYDIVAGQVDETEYERTQRLLMKEHLIRTLKRYLSPHEVDLLLLRYGLMDERALPRGMSGPLTIAEVSKLVGLKPDKVRRIIINSQKQLKHLMKEWEDFEYELA